MRPVFPFATLPGQPHLPPYWPPSYSLAPPGGQRDTVKTQPSSYSEARGDLGLISSLNPSATCSGLLVKWLSEKIKHKYKKNQKP